MLHFYPPSPPYQGGDKKSICHKHLVIWYYSCFDILADFDAPHG